MPQHLASHQQQEQQTDRAANQNKSRTEKHQQHENMSHIAMWIVVLQTISLTDSLHPPAYNDTNGAHNAPQFLAQRQEDV